MVKSFARVLLGTLMGLALGACVPKSDLDTAQSENARLQAQVAQLEKRNTELSAYIAKKPVMPVKVSLRPAILGTGYVAVFATTIKQDFPILVTVKSLALGTSKQFRVQMNAMRPSELGSTDGAAIDIDDEMLIENTNFEPATLKFLRN